MAGRRVTTALTALVAGAGCLLAACGGSGGSGRSITLYSGQHPQTTNALVTAFEKATGISVSVSAYDEDTLADEIVTQGSHSPADVFYTENSPALEYLQERGLLARVDKATLARTQARYDSEQDDWVGVSARVSVIIYNPRLITRSRLPATAAGLASPRYRGKLALAPAETDFQPIITAYRRAYGRAATLRWLAGIKSNAAGHVYPDNETIASKVNSGAVAFGVINQYYWYRMRDEIGAPGMHSDLAYFAPRDPGYVIDVSGAAVLRSSTHRAAAQRFLAFLVSRAGQEIIADPARSASYEYPLADGVTTQAPETPFGQLRPYPITPGELGDGQTAVHLLQQAGLS